MTNLPEFRRPHVPLASDRVALLRSWLDEQRFDIVAAYHTAECWPDGVEQETIHFELRDPPEIAAPPALSMAVSIELPPQVLPTGFTFPSQETVPKIRAEGLLLWQRDPLLPAVEPKEANLVYERPEIPGHLVAVLREELGLWQGVEGAYFVTARLVVGDEEVWSRLQLFIDADEARRAIDAVRPILQANLSSVGVGNSYPDRPAIRRNGLVVYERDG